MIPAQLESFYFKIAQECIGAPEHALWYFFSCFLFLINLVVDNLQLILQKEYLIPSENQHHKSSRQAPQLTQQVHLITKQALLSNFAIPKSTHTLPFHFLLQFWDPAYTNIYICDEFYLISTPRWPKKTRKNTRNKSSWIPRQRRSPRQQRSH